MGGPPNEYHVKPIAWVWAAGIVAASIGGAAFVTQWKPMTRSRAGTAIPVASGSAPKPYRLPMERPNLPIPATQDVTDPGAALYMGVSRLLGGDAAGAIEPLTAAVRLSTGQREQDARWFLAVALERAGRVDDAVAVLDALCGAEPVPGSVPGSVPGPVPRTQQACAGAAALRRP
jgi:hypothetical protein